MSSWARENPERMAVIAGLPASEQVSALRAEYRALRVVPTPPCKQRPDPFFCPRTYHKSEWSEQLRAYFCTECGVDE